MEEVVEEVEEVEERRSSKQQRGASSGVENECHKSF